MHTILVSVVELSLLALLYKIQHKFIYFTYHFDEGTRYCIVDMSVCEIGNGGFTYDMILFSWDNMKDIKSFDVLPSPKDCVNLVGKENIDKMLLFTKRDVCTK